MTPVRRSLSLWSKACKHCLHRCKQNIKSAIDAKLSAHNFQRSKSSVNANDVVRQHIKDILKIFTQEEADKLQNHRVSEAAKFTVIVERHAEQKIIITPKKKAEPDWVHPSP